MEQGYIIDELKRNPTGIVMSDELFNKAFREPKKATVEDMALIINAKLGLSNHIHQGGFSHVTEKTRAEKLMEFCERHYIEHYEDQINREHHFRFNFGIK